MFAFIADLIRNRINKPDYHKSGFHNLDSTSFDSTLIYDPNLIDVLKYEHSELIVLYESMWKQGFEKKDYQKLARTIELFKVDFQSHILKENVKLFVYLEKSISKEQNALKLVKTFHHEINDIATAVLPFCKKYGITPYTLEMEKDFERDYLQIGHVLKTRIEAEESQLYTLYRPSF
ncbi:MAG: hemerythrin domain-containing protein [Gammaproteobacteria bacterium]|nr:hemerythrin domain-containing protein [Gammaproteobacteria bacterium]